MDEQFEHRSLLALDTLRTLQQRSDVPSALRLLAQLAILLGSAAAVVTHSGQPLVEWAAAMLLALAWAAIFAPFHEATHQTAFRGSRANALATWLTGIPFGLAPAVYRTFHFEHHRHTHDPQRDPEIAPDPRTAMWPSTRRGWLLAALGYKLMLLKGRLTVEFVRRPPAQWAALGAWTAHIDDPATLARECRILAALWLLFLVSALTWLPGGGWLLLALWFGQVLQTLWLMCEHTGLPHSGSILRRTRSVLSNACVRWWLWNMNYHAEHHAWPSIPWHHLPAAHAAINTHLEACAPGYVALHRSVLAGAPLATPAP